MKTNIIITYDDPVYGVKKNDFDLFLNASYFYPDYRPELKQLGTAVFRLLEIQIRHGMTPEELTEFINDSSIFPTGDRHLGGSQFSGFKVLSISIE